MSGKTSIECALCHSMITDESPTNYNEREMAYVHRWSVFTVTGGDCLAGTHPSLLASGFKNFNKFLCSECRKKPVKVELVFSLNDDAG
ncbi:MAG: hypothetical protein WC551_10220 [Patescibacteria group bacterium]